MRSSDPVVCVVQARMGSTRLPGKVLADLAGRPMLEFLLDRLAALPSSVVVATSDHRRDDAVAEVATGAGFGLVRGPEQDVLGRYGRALEQFPAEHIVRITGDCPLVDPEIVAAVVDLHLEREADYSCNVLPRTFPKGLDVEVVATSALRVALAEADAPAEREHVTPFFYRHPERFRLANLRSGDDLGEERWTVDTPEDLEAVRQIVRELGDTTRFGWRDALAVTGRNAHPRAGEVHLRPAGPDDSERVLALRNDRDSVRFSLSRATVTDEEHRRWFAERLNDPATRLCIVEVDDEALGMVRVETEDAVGMVSIAIDPTRREQGLARRALLALVETFRGDFQAVRLDALVDVDNEASAAAFRAAGFRPVGVTQSIERFTWDNERA